MSLLIKSVLYTILTVVAVLCLWNISPPISLDSTLAFIGGFCTTLVLFWDFTKE